MIEVTSAQTLSEAYALLGKRPRGLRVLAGGTDFMVALHARASLERIGHVLDIWKVRELRGIEKRGQVVCLGALTTYSELVRSPLLREVCPALTSVSAEVGAWGIQNRGTLGGNICNASPAGDTLPILLAADARFVLGGPRGERTVAAADFFVAYRKTALGADELLIRVELPLLEGARIVYRKVGTRKAQAISKTLVAVRGSCQAGRLWQVRIAAGCVAPVPLRCKRAEAAVEGKRVGPEVLSAARAALQDDIKPIADVRSSVEYRRRVTGNLLERLLRQLQCET